MAGKLQNWFSRNIWDLSGHGVDGLATINGSLLQSILSYGDTDEPVTIRRALGLTPVYISVTVPAKTIASLPLNVIKEDGRNKTVVTDHPVYYSLCHEPNDYMSSANFWLTLMIHALAWGNGIARIHRDSRNNPIAYTIHEPGETDVKWSDGQWWYHYQGDTISYRDVLHIRYYSLDGVRGCSPILENKNTIGRAFKLNRFEGLATGARPPAILSYEGHLTPEQIKQNELRWKNPGSQTKVMDGKWTYQPIMNSPEHSQYIEARDSVNQEIYGIWQLPPSFAQNYERMTWSNSEQADIVYAKHTITPLIRVIEQECNLKLFRTSEKATTYVKFNLNGLLRGDVAARQAFYQSMVNTGVMSRNEARSYEDMNPYKSGDDFLVQGAMVPADLLRKNMEAMIDAASAKPEPPPTTEKIYGKNGSYIYQ